MDFACYGAVPLGIAIFMNQPEVFVWVIILEITFFVNAAGLFFLSALIEINKNAKKSYGNKKEVTTLKMPPALIEGMESYLFFTLMIIFHEEYMVVLC